MAFRDVLSFKSVSGLLSPDGQTVLFTVQRNDLKKNTTLTSAWKVPFEGGEPVQLTRETGGDRMFQWSPDGRLISFLGEREIEHGLFVMRPDGGEPRKLFSHDPGILQYQWSPDGLRIAFVSLDKPSDEEDLVRKEKRDVVIEGGDRRMSHIWIHDLEANREWPLTSGGELTVLSFAWSPDSKSVAFAAVPSPNAADYIRSDIYLVPVKMPDSPPNDPASGPIRPTKLTDNAGEDLLPQYTPDGRFIVYRSRPEGDLVSGYRHLQMVAGGGSPEDISPRGDFTAGSYTYGPNGRTVYFAGFKGVESNLYRMSLEDRLPVQLTPGKGVWQSPSFSKDKKRCVFTFQDPLHPQELFAAPISDPAGRRLTDLNGRTAGALHLGETEVVSWRTFDGRLIDGLLVRPRTGKEARGKRHPLIVDIHGGPAGLSMLDFSPEAQYFAGLGFIVFKPNFRGSAGFGEAFRSAAIGDWGGGDFRDIMAGIETLLTRPDVDADRIGSMGWSFGGYMTAWMVARTSLFKAAIVGAGMVDNLLMWGTQDSPPHYAAYFGGDPFEKNLGDLYRERSPLTHIKNIRTPVLIMHGEEDKRVPASQALLFYNALKAVGADVELVWYPRTGHAPQEPRLRLDVVQRQAAWFSRHLLGTEMPLWPKEGAGKAPQPLQDEGSVFLRAKEEFLKSMSREGIVGGALVVMRADRELLKVDHGWANLEKKAPANEATIYDWGSITKLLTSLAVMQLEHHGGLRIDDPVQAHIPAFRNIGNPFRNTDRITLRMLMSHTSGLQEASFLIPLSWDGDWPVWAQIEPNLNYVRVERDPGTGYAYSNFGPMVLGRIIEVVSRDNYETYVDKNLFKPLGMPESYFNRTPYHLKANKAQSYFKGPAGSPRMLYAPDLDQGFTATNGGWKCSIRDFKKFVRFLLGSADPEAQAVYDSILPRPLLESMWIPVAGADQPGLACGLGFLIKAQAAQSVIGSSGGSNGFVCNMFIHRRSGTAAFMVGNTDNFGDVMRPVRDLLIEALARFPD